MIRRLNKCDTGLELLNELLPTVWDSPVRVFQRYDIRILIYHEEDDFVAVVVFVKSNT